MADAAARDSINRIVHGWDRLELRFLINEQDRPVAGTDSVIFVRRLCLRSYGAGGDCEGRSVREERSPIE